MKIYSETLHNIFKYFNSHTSIFLENWNWGAIKYWGPVPSRPFPSPPSPSLPSPAFQSLYSSSPPIPSHIPPLPLEVDPFNPARGSGERCNLPSGVWDGAIVVHFSLKI